MFSADLNHNYLQIIASLASAARDCGRDPASIRLLVVSKQQPAGAIELLANAGQCDFGESYLQEALAKIASLNARNLTWHFIGQLQSNKTRPVAEHFQWVHTLDRVKIAARLNEQRPHYAPPLNVCLQVKLAEEAGKGGLWPEEVPALAKAVSELPHLKLRGLMCIPPPQDSYVAQLAQFQRMQQLRNELNTQGYALDTLSMGMSDDYTAAIAAGATLVRIGTALFGPRPR
jgi:PLP dependent protein